MLSSPNQNPKPLPSLTAIHHPLIPLQVPWSSLGTVPVEAKIDRLYLLASPKTEEERGKGVRKEVCWHEWSCQAYHGHDMAWGMACHNVGLAWHGAGHGAWPRWLGMGVGMETMSGVFPAAPCPSMLSVAWPIYNLAMLIHAMACQVRCCLCHALLCHAMPGYAMALAWHGTWLSPIAYFCKSHAAPNT